MKILHVFDHSIPLHSGYTFRSLNILKKQRELGYETCHVTSAKQGSVKSSKEVVEGLDFYRCSPVKVQGGIREQISVIRGLKAQLLKVIAIEKPDVIHAHSPSLNGYAAIKVGHKLGIPVVYEIRAFWEDAAVDHGTARHDGLRYKLTRKLETWVIKKADHITCICEGLKTDLIDRGIPESKITIIPNAVNIDEFDVIRETDQALCAQYELNDKKVVGFIGSFYGYEGLDLLLKGFALAKSKRSDLVCLLVGGGKEEAHLKKLVKQLELEDSVIFTGRVPHSEVSRYYSIVDILLYPRKSKRITELVTPLKPLEAMAMGRVFAASDVGGHRELVSDSETGFIFNSDDPEAISNAVSRILDTPTGQIEQMKTNALRYVKEERNWKVSVSRYTDVYPKLN